MNFGRRKESLTVIMKGNNESVFERLCTGVVSHRRKDTLSVEVHQRFTGFIPGMEILS